jgi:EAL domain-containing protein (putative c-di-GMP-specific phosphodiesterase class I)
VVWLTREGDLHDFILAPGEFIEVARGLPVVVALERAVLSAMEHALRSWLRGVLGMLRASIGGHREATAASAG